MATDPAPVSAPASEARRQHAEFLSRLIDQAPIGMYVVDADFRLAQLNDQAAPVFALLRAPIGRDFEEIMHAL